MRKSHPPLIACLAFLSIAPVAIADTPSSWILIETRPNQDQLYLNVRTIQKKGAVVTFDAFNRFGTTTPTGVAAIAITYEGNCRYPRLRQIEGASYDANLQLLATGNAPASERKWQIVKQGTGAYTALAKACQAAKLRR